MSKVANEFGVEIDYNMAENLMDDELREQIAFEASCETEQEFFDEYAKRHKEKFDEEWELAKKNPVY